MINVGIWRSSFNSLFCHRFPQEDLISLCLSSSHKTWPVFHRDAEWISTPWKGTNLWDAQRTQQPCQPCRPLPWGSDGEWLSLGLFCLPLKCSTKAWWWGHQPSTSSEERLEASNSLLQGPTSSFPCFRSEHCSTRGDDLRSRCICVAHCVAMQGSQALKMWQPAWANYLPSSRGLVQARHHADAAVLLPVPQLVPSGRSQGCAPLQSLAMPVGTFHS